MKSLDKVIWWMEYVIRHKGAKHLKCPRADIPWWKYYLLDILAYYIFYASVMLYFGYKILTYLSKSLYQIKKIVIFKIK